MGWTDGRTDNVKTVYHPQTQFHTIELCETFCKMPRHMIRFSCLDTNPWFNHNLNVDFPFVICKQIMSMVILCYLCVFDAGLTWKIIFIYKTKEHKLNDSKKRGTRLRVPPLLVKMVWDSNLYTVMLCNLNVACYLLDNTGFVIFVLHSDKYSCHNKTHSREYSLNIQMIQVYSASIIILSFGKYPLRYSHAKRKGNSWKLHDLLNWSEKRFPCTPDLDFRCLRPIREIAHILRTSPWERWKTNSRTPAALLPYVDPLRHCNVKVTSPWHMYDASQRIQDSL